MKNKSRKQKSHKIGHYAETIAAFYLRFKGYKILKRRFKTRNGEIDLIATKNNILVFVEVKYRRDASLLPYSIPPKNRRRINRAAAAYLSHNAPQKNMQCRFDALLLSPWKSPQHIKNAWMLESQN